MTPLHKGFTADTSPADRRTPWQWCGSHIVVDNTSPMPGAGVRTIHLGSRNRWKSPPFGDSFSAHNTSRAHSIDDDKATVLFSKRRSQTPDRNALRSALF